MGDNTKLRAARRRTIRAGQPNAPPPRPKPVDLDVAVVTAADVMALSLERGELERIRAIRAASDINDALAEALHIAATEPSGAAGSHARWCTAVGISARDLCTSLMSSSPEDGYLPFDAFELLKLGVPQDGDVEFHQILQGMLQNAVPLDRVAETDELVLIALAHLAPGLKALSLLADRAAAHWAESTRRGGSAPNRARAHLIARLCDVYEALFDKAPTVVTKYTATATRTHRPGGPTLEWFTRVFTLLEERLPNTSEVASLKAIAVDACTGSDAIAHWLRESRQQRRSKPPSTV